MEHVFKLFEFNVYNDKGQDNDSDEGTIMKDSAQFTIQMFGINESGQKASIIVEEYKPFFYLKVNNNWGQTKKTAFYNHLKTKMGKFYQDSITDCKLIERKKLYGFDAGKKHRFIEVKFANVNAYNKVKNMWYQDCVNEDGERERKLIKNGYKFFHNNETTFIELYEANIPPLLRFFHIREISPSGWVALPIKKTLEITGINKTTTCDYEYSINYKNIIPLNHKEDRVPYKIMSFDIEASSSHGDFPVPIKSYKKLATNIVDHFDKYDETDTNQCKSTLRQIVNAAFGFSVMSNIDLVYPKEPIKSLNELSVRTENWLKTKVRDRKDDSNEEHLIEALFETANKSMIVKDKEEKDNDDENGESDDDDNDNDDNNLNGGLEEEKQFSVFSINKSNYNKTYGNKESTIVDILCDKKFEREGKINELIRSLRNNFPSLEGDKVTFIGSTFITYGNSEPYLNHCIVLNSCDPMAVANPQMETYCSEKDVLLAWTALVQRENPDIIIGYNIFSFDYEFMFRRAQELNCVEDFLKLSRNKDEICGAVDYKNPKK